MSIEIEATGAEATEIPTTPRRRGRRWWAASAVVIMLAAAVGSYVVTHRGTAAQGPPPVGAVSTAVMEDRYGVRIDLVGLAALGGLLELRFTVLDKDKATGLFHDATLTPEILVERSGAVLHPPSGMAHKLVLLNGASYFMLFTNVGDAVQEGDLLSIVVDQVRIEHIPAQS